jgi:hypothetical protein
VLIFGHASLPHRKLSTMTDAAAGVDGADYADTYDDDDDDNHDQVTPASTTRQRGLLGHEEEDDGDDDDDNELAEMFAKVQTIQQAEGIHVKPMQARQQVVGAEPYAELVVTIPDRADAGRKSSTTPTSATSSRTASPAGSRGGITRSADGITTISRRAITSGGAHIDVLSGVKKPALFQNRLLQTAKQQPQTLEQLKQKVVTGAPGTKASSAPSQPT